MTKQKAHIFFLVIILVILFSPPICISQDKVKVTGFRNLKWGTSFEKALKIYPDLSFLGNAGKVKFYKRNKEDYLLSNSKPDEVYYYFIKNKFFKVKASIRREPKKNVEIKDTIVLNTFPIQKHFISFELYSKIKKNIEFKYGKPEENYFGNPRNTIWHIGDSEIELFAYGWDTGVQLDLRIENIKESANLLGF